MINAQAWNLCDSPRFFSVDYKDLVGDRAVVVRRLSYFFRRDITNSLQAPRHRSERTRFVREHQETDLHVGKIHTVGWKSGGGVHSFDLLNDTQKNIVRHALISLDSYVIAQRAREVSSLHGWSVLLCVLLRLYVRVRVCECVVYVYVYPVRAHANMCEYVNV
jgi:hypothetical protein